MTNDNEQAVRQIIRENQLALTVPQAAERLNISDSTMRELARTQGFPAFNVGKKILISVKGLESWVETQAQRGVIL